MEIALQLFMVLCVIAGFALMQRMKEGLVVGGVLVMLVIAAHMAPNMAPMRQQTLIGTKTVEPMKVDISADGVARVIVNVTSQDGSRQQCAYATIIVPVASGVSFTQPKATDCHSI